MKKHFILVSLLLFLSLWTSGNAVGESILTNSVQEPKLVINNRILAKVNGQAISVIDIMKKMDMLFYRQYPEYATSIPARFQYYQANWKRVLNEMMDKELILADAETSKLVVSAGDVRQEMETLFGPNIIANLDKIGLTFSEASKMVLDDITMRRMMYFRVQSKAISAVTPQIVRDNYEKIAKDNIRDNEWIFSVVTIRHKDPTKAAETANLVHHLLAENKVPLEQLSTTMQEQAAANQKLATVTVSEEFHTKEKELSEPFKKILVTIAPDSYSAPISQKSRSDNSSVVRIFYLNKMIAGGVIPYNELADKIKNKLVDDGINKETDIYLKKLRQQHHVQESQLDDLYNSNFKPFELE